MSWYDELEPETRARALVWSSELRRAGIGFFPVSVRRSLWTEQRILRSAGVTCTGCASAHAIGRAFDAETSHPHRAGGIWRRLGGKWSPRDPEHFEL